MIGRPPRPAIERFFDHVSVDGDCWLWTAGRTLGGYGNFTDADRRVVLAHRWSFAAFVGPIPAGMQLDHLCRVRHCVNPDHLEPVTARENVRRSEGLGAVNIAKTECPAGHPYDEANTYVLPNGGRACRPCGRRRQREYQERKRRASLD